MAKKRNRITLEMSKTISETSPLIKSTKKIITEDKNIIKNIDINLLEDNPYQPRIDINNETLNDLISSIEENGLLQPILITKSINDGYYTIIAGHRRYEAFKILGKNSIPCLIKNEVSKKDLAIFSLTENLLRENLHPIENAIAIKNILDNNIVESQNKLAQYVGLSKGYVSKLLNILNLPSSFIKIIKNDNYKDINILILLNKLDNIEIIENVYHNIKNLNRKEAQFYIKNLASKKEDKEQSINIKKTNNSLILNINMKNLDNDTKILVNDKVEQLNNEIIKLLNKEKING